MRKRRPREQKTGGRYLVNYTTKPITAAERRKKKRKLQRVARRISKGTS